MRTSTPPECDYVPDDSLCAQCNAKLPDVILRGTPQYEGFCTNKCMIDWQRDQEIKKLKALDERRCMEDYGEALRKVRTL